MPVTFKTETTGLKAALDKTHKIVEHILTLTDLPLIVNFSGGKDSSAMLLTTLDVTDRVEALYMDSGITLPGTLEFVKRQAKRLGVKLIVSHPDRSLDDFVRAYHCFPIHIHPWCSKALKIRPARRHLRKLFGNKPLYQLVGVRKSESARRQRIYDFKNRTSGYNPIVDGHYNIVKDSEHSGSFKCFPILHWTDENVLEFLTDRDFEINKNYEHFGIADCYWCPFYQREIYARILRVYPRIYDGIIKLEEELGKPSCSGRVWLRDIKREIESQTKLVEVL